MTSAVRSAWRYGLSLGATFLCAAVATQGGASTFVETQIRCAVGGKPFKHMALASISTWGAMPDGMPIGSGVFPNRMPQCPDNGLIMYREFKPEEVKVLAAFIGSPDYAALRSAGETPYYLAYKTADRLGDPDLAWLLLYATWEAKNAEPEGERARRYNREFVSLVMASPADDSSIESIAVRARAANALRELGRFDEAEKLRAGIRIAPDAGGADDDAAANRDGWGRMLASLAAPITRKDQNRTPIDMMDEREAVHRCASKELAKKYDQPEPLPLSSFEQDFCARPELVSGLVDLRKQLE